MCSLYFQTPDASDHPWPADSGEDTELSDHKGGTQKDLQYVQGYQTGGGSSGPGHQGHL